MLKITGVLRPLKQINRCFSSSIRNQYSIKKTPEYSFKSKKEKQENLSQKKPEELTLKEKLDKDLAFYRKIDDLRYKFARPGQKTNKSYCPLIYCKLKWFRKTLIRLTANTKLMLKASY